MGDIDGALNNAGRSRRVALHAVNPFLCFFQHRELRHFDRKACNSASRPSLYTDMTGSLVVVA